MMEDTPKTGAFRPIECVMVIFAITIGLALLLPAVYSSREKARAHFCQENLRRLDTALKTFRALQGHNPSPSAWPVELLPILAREPDEIVLSGIPMQKPRPSFLTCPSNPKSTETRPFEQISLYVAVQTVDENGDETWVFRDRSASPVRSMSDHWCVGIVLNDIEARAQLARPGPHGNRYYQQSDGRGYDEDEM